MRTVREDLLTALEAMLTPCPPGTHVIGPDGECPECDVEKQARAAIERARREPEEHCDCRNENCPTFKAGMERMKFAGREPSIYGSGDELDSACWRISTRGKRARPEDIALVERAAQGHDPYECACRACGALNTLRGGPVRAWRHGKRVKEDIGL